MIDIHTYQFVIKVLLLDKEVIFFNQQFTHIDVPSNYFGHIEEFIYLDDPQVVPPLLPPIAPPPQVVPPF